MQKVWLQPHMLGLVGVCCSCLRQAHLTGRCACSLYAQHIMHVAADHAAQQTVSLQPATGSLSLQRAASRTCKPRKHGQLASHIAQILSRHADPRRLGSTVPRWKSHAHGLLRTVVHSLSANTWLRAEHGCNCLCPCGCGDCSGLSHTLCSHSVISGEARMHVLPQ